MFEIRVPVNALIHFSFGCRKCPRATQATHLLRKNARTQRTQPPLCRGPHPLDQRYRSKHRILSVQKNSRGPSAQAQWFPAEGLALVQDFPCAGLPLRRCLSAEQASKLRGPSRQLQRAPLRKHAGGCPCRGSSLITRSVDLLIQGFALSFFASGLGRHHRRGDIGPAE